MTKVITKKLRAEISNAVTLAKYPDHSRIVREIEEHIIKIQLSKKQIIKLLKNLIDNFPWEYLRGWAEFNDSKFIVTKDTLIPRLETEMLATLAIKKIQTFNKPLQIIDVGTGSGAIIISVIKQLKKNKTPYTKAIAIDLSNQALKIAKENKHNLIPNEDVDFINTNLLDTNKINFDSPTLILANLPYISEKEYKQLDISVKKYEPHLALVGGNIGHELYIELLNQSTRFTSQIKQIWEASPSTIPYLTKYLNKKKIPHQIVRDQFQIERFIII